MKWLKGKVREAHTGRGIMPVSTSETEKINNLQDLL